MTITASDKVQASLFTGKDNWTTREDAEDAISSIRFSDGPHGLRIERKEGLGFNESHPATAYPTASLTACSFDRSLQYELGVRLGRECCRDNVDVLLGPGVNHKRSPLCGRNFEYYSEDPYLSGELGAAYVNGVQSQGIGTSVKHFAGNSREYGRMVQNSVIDERALQELYLSQFERVIKLSRPWTVMCAYNRLNGTYACENESIMSQARKEWGFDGAFISDWGAAADPVASIRAGLNLEMPGGDHGSDERILRAISDGTLSHDVLEHNTEILKALSDKTKAEKPSVKEDDHIAFARRAAEESGVLLKNGGALPLKKTDTVALIGPFAKDPRIQGAGSSKVNASHQDCMYEVMKEGRVLFSYAQGFSLNTETPDARLEEQALNLALRSDRIIVMAGLPEGDEAEGHDRAKLDLPQNQNDLIRKLTLISSNVIVVMHCGAPVVMPWADRVNAILCMYLGGCQSAAAGYRLLSGAVNPSGHLAETWPKRLADTPSFRCFSNSLLEVQYRESIYSGYRYYDTAKIEPLFPFGHGLSYTEFSYRDLRITPETDCVRVSVSVSNTGAAAGKEVVQLYVAMEKSRIARSTKELKGFEKIELAPGETKTVEFVLDDRSFSYFDTAKHKWMIETGSYTVLVGASSRDIRLKGNVFRTGTTDPYSSIPADYLKQDADGTAVFDDEGFARVLGGKIPPIRPVRPFTINSSIYELSESGMGKLIRMGIEIGKQRLAKKNISEDIILEAPIRTIFWISSHVTWDTAEAIADLFNGNGSIRKIKQTLHKD